jgi:hypothetical protein
MEENERSTNLFVGITPAEEIQLMFPNEPDWQHVPDDVLVELVRTYYQELSCAGAAIIYLKSRCHPDAATLAQWLLTRSDIDEWLRETALEVVSPEEEQGSE